MQPIAPLKENEDVTIEGVPSNITPRRKVRFEYGNGDSPLSGFTIKRGLGVGGFGEVYHAQSSSGKNVALKRVLRNVDIETRGVRQCLNVRHPNLIALYDLRQDDDDQSWVVMELVEGESLRAKLDRFPAGMPKLEADELFAQLVAGVTFLHDQGLVHRDLKPANIFIENGLVKIGDYGLSKFISSSQRGGQTESIGTFHYMAPEIGRGEYGKEIDIYALGIIYYEMLTGEVPFDGESVQEIIVKHLSASPDLSRLPNEVQGVVGRALAKDPGARFKSGRDLLFEIGWQLNTTGLATKREMHLDSPLNPSVPTTATTASHVSPLPVARRLDQTAPKGKTLPHVAPENIFRGEPRVYASGPADVAGATGGQSLGRTFDSAELSGSIGRDNSVLYREPIAKFMHSSLHRFFSFSHSLPRTASIILTLCLIILAMGVVLNGGWVFILFGLMLYAVYYPFYFLLSRAKDMTVGAVGKVRHMGQSRGHFAGSFASVIELPLEQSSDSMAARFSSVASVGFLWAGLLILCAFLGQRVDGFWTEDTMLPFLWLGTMVVLTVWAIILISSRPNRPGAKLKVRLIQSLVGVVLGGVSVVAVHLLKEPEAIASFDGLRTGVRDAFIDRNQWGSSLSFFAGWMFLSRWWTVTNVYRNRKFRISTILLSALIGATVAVLVDFDFTMAIAFAALVAIFVQIASPKLSLDTNPTVGLENKHAA